MVLHQKLTKNGKPDFEYEIFGPMNVHKYLAEKLTSPTGPDSDPLAKHSISRRYDLIPQIHKLN